MNFKNTLLGLFTVLSLGFSSANAGVLLEPYLGYKIASGDRAITTATEYSFNTPTIGGRVGYQFLGFMAGLDYSMSTGSFGLETKTLTTTTEVNNDQDQFGLFVGYNLPILFRVWGTYFLSSNLEQADGDENKGSGFALGAGFTGLPFVSLNLEIRSISYDEFYDKSAGTTTTLNPTSDYTEVLLSVSMPIDL